MSCRQATARLALGQTGARTKPTGKAAVGSGQHEPRTAHTALNAIIGPSQALLDEIFGSLTEKQKKLIQNIEGNAGHLLELI